MSFFIIFATSQFYSKMIWCCNLISCIYVDSNATTELSCRKNFLGVPRALILHFQKYIKNHQQNRLGSVAIHGLFERKRQKNEILYVFRTPPTPPSHPLKPPSPHPFPKVTNFVTKTIILCDLALFDNFHLYYNILLCFTSHLELLGTNLCRSFNIFFLFLLTSLKKFMVSLKV